MKHYLLLLALSTCVFMSSASSPPLLSTAAQDAFFESIKAHCGKAFAGKIIIDNQPSASFTDKSLVMHVRQCSDTQLHIPFHVGDDHSRTWIITKTGSGLSLKHDHRKQDGSDDALTMYGGHTIDSGFAQVQSFPADAPTIEMFTRLAIPQSNTNVWQMYVYEDTFTYRLTREGREFRVDFDLQEAVERPPVPWGYE